MLGARSFGLFVGGVRGGVSRLRLQRMVALQILICTRFHLLLLFALLADRRFVLGDLLAGLFERFRGLLRDGTRLLFGGLLGFQSSESRAQRIQRVLAGADHGLALGAFAVADVGDVRFVV